jgi:hypothetical protein
MVEVNAAKLDRMVEETHAQLLSTGLYQRSGFICRPSFIKGLDRDGKETQSPGILNVTADQLHLHAIQNIEYFQWGEIEGKDGETKRVPIPVACPKGIATKLLGLGDQLKFRVLNAVVTTPVLFNNGRVLQTPGYDAKSGLFYNPIGVVFPPIPDAPTREDALAAEKEIKELLKEYPWRHENEGETKERNVSLSVALAYLLTVVNRAAYRAVPIFGFNGNVPRVGKGKLVSAGSVIATGERAAVIPASLSAEEFEKRLCTCFITGQPLIVLDNLSEPLYSDTLASGVTEDYYKIRKFGTNDVQFKIPNTFTIAATGNKLAIVRDLAPRTLMAGIVVLEENPEAVYHSFDPVRLAEQRRGELVVAVLTILKAHILAGRPEVAPNGEEKKLTPFGSFEEWSAGVRAALVWLGEMDPVSSVASVKATDTEGAMLAELIELWDAAIGSEPVGTSRLIEEAKTFEFPENSKEHPLQDLLGRICQGPIDAGKLGGWLGYRVEVVIGGKYLTAKANKKTKRRIWTLVNGRKPQPEQKVEPSEPVVQGNLLPDEDGIPF